MFSDVRIGTFYDEAVGELHNLGIVQGYDDGRFGPNDYVTRGQIAVLMKRLRDELMGEELAGSQAPSSTLAASVISVLVPSVKLTNNIGEFDMIFTYSIIFCSSSIHIILPI